MVKMRAASLLGALMPSIGDAPAKEPDVDVLAAEALLVQVLLLGGVLAAARAIQKAKIGWLGDSGCGLLIGVVCGLGLRLAGAGPALQNWLTFKKQFFMLAILPIIMFDAGFGLDPTPFVRNIGSVCALAFVGTTISTFVVGLLMWGFGMAGWCTALPLIYNLLFGALISATDPVTVLAVFSQLGANEDLYINVFGESVLNDAVALVLYDTMTIFVGQAATTERILNGIAVFVGVFAGSVLVGLAVGFLSAIVFRTGWFRDTAKHGSLIEAGMVVVLAFVSYLSAQAAHLSGICAILFCGMIMRAFVAPNMSSEARERLDSLLGTLASLAELFAFVYIGLTLFLSGSHFNAWSYTALSLVALAISRAANVFPCAATVNWLRLPERRMPGKQQFMLWWSGLRGAMAFALAMDAAEDYGEMGQLMKTSTLYIVIVTVLVNGGSCAHLLERLGLRHRAPPGWQPLMRMSSSAWRAQNGSMTFRASPSSRLDPEMVGALLQEPAEGTADASSSDAVATISSGAPQLKGEAREQKATSRSWLHRLREFNSVHLEAHAERASRSLTNMLVGDARTDL